MPSFIPRFHIPNLAYWTRLFSFRSKEFKGSNDTNAKKTEYGTKRRAEEVTDHEVPPPKRKVTAELRIDLYQQKVMSLKEQITKMEQEHQHERNNFEDALNQAAVQIQDLQDTLQTKVAEYESLNQQMNRIRTAASAIENKQDGDETSDEDPGRSSLGSSQYAETHLSESPEYEPAAPKSESREGSAVLGAPSNLNVNDQDTKPELSPLPDYEFYEEQEHEAMQEQPPNTPLVAEVMPLNTLLQAFDPNYRNQPSESDSATSCSPAPSPPSPRSPRRWPVVPTFRPTTLNYNPSAPRVANPPSPSVSRVATPPSPPSPSLPRVAIPPSTHNQASRIYSQALPTYNPDSPTFTPASPTFNGESPSWDSDMEVDQELPPNDSTDIEPVSPRMNAPSSNNQISPTQKSESPTYDSEELEVDQEWPPNQLLPNYNFEAPQYTHWTPRQPGSYAMQNASQASMQMAPSADSLDPRYNYSTATVDNAVGHGTNLIPTINYMLRDVPLPSIEGSSPRRLYDSWRPPPQQPDTWRPRPQGPALLSAEADPFSAHGLLTSQRVPYSESRRDNRHDSYFTNDQRQSATHNDYRFANTQNPGYGMNNTYQTQDSTPAFYSDRFPNINFDSPQLYGRRGFSPLRRRHSPRSPLYQARATPRDTHYTSTDRVIKKERISRSRSSSYY